MLRQRRGLLEAIATLALSSRSVTTPEQQVSAAFVQLHVAQLVDAQKVLSDEPHGLVTLATMLPPVTSGGLR